MTQSTYNTGSASKQTATSHHMSEMCHVHIPASNYAKY